MLCNCPASAVNKLKFITAKTKEPKTAAVPNQPETFFGKNLPTNPLIKKPINGKNIINVNIPLSF
jgi:hypothetical protein